MLDFQERMAVGKAQRKRDLEHYGSSSVRLVTTAERYAGMTHEDWNDWHGEGNVAGTVDAVPADCPQHETEEVNMPKATKRTSSKPRGTATISYSWGQILDPKIYVKALAQLGLSPYGAGPVLGISPRQTMRYAQGDSPIPESIAKLIWALLRTGTAEL